MLLRCITIQGGCYTKLYQVIRKKLYQKYKRSGSIAIYAKFIQVKHSVQKELRISYQNYINNLISFECDDNSWQNTHLKKFWSFIKGLRKENPSITYLNYNGNVLVDPIAKADALNSHFKSIFTTEDHSCLPNKGPCNCKSPSYNS